MDGTFSSLDWNAPERPLHCHISSATIEERKARHRPTCIPAKRPTVVETKTARSRSRHKEIPPETAPVRPLNINGCPDYDAGSIYPVATCNSAESLCLVNLRSGCNSAAYGCLILTLVASGVDTV